MPFALIATGIAALGLFTVIWIRRARERREVELYSITPDGLHDLLASSPGTLLFDLREPLDVLAHSEIIPGAKRISPRDLLASPTLIPNDKDSVVYCTCTGEKTSRRVSREARAMNFFRVKFLKGGLEGWKAKGYPVEPYKESFQLDTTNLARAARR